MLTWTITRGHDSEATVVEFGWRGRSIAFRPLERDDVEQGGSLKHGDWLMDGRWLAFYRERYDAPNAYEHSTSVGVAFGQRAWELTWAWRNRDGRAPGEIIKGSGEAARQRLNELYDESTERDEDE